MLQTETLKRHSNIFALFILVLSFHCVLIGYAMPTRIFSIHQNSLTCVDDPMMPHRHIILKTCTTPRLSKKALAAIVLCPPSLPSKSLTCSSYLARCQGGLDEDSTTAGNLYLRVCRELLPCSSFAVASHTSALTKVMVWLPGSANFNI